MNAAITSSNLDTGPAGYRTLTVAVRVDGVARPGIVPGYPGHEMVTVAVREDGSASSYPVTFGRHGYQCDGGKVRAAAIRAARREWARVTAA